MRSGREHWAWMVVVEVRQGTLGIAGRNWTRRTRRKGLGGGGGRRQAEGRRTQEAIDIKSNNRHLANEEIKNI